jgi:predicted hydrocarbon binding protein
MSQEDFMKWLQRNMLIVNRLINHDITIARGDNPNELKISHPQCIYCAGQGLLTRPACLLVPTFYRQAILELTGISCRMDEVRCGAMYGEDTCHYVLRRI